MPNDDVPDAGAFGEDDESDLTRDDPATTSNTSGHSKRQRDMSNRIGPGGRTQHDAAISGRIDSDKTTVRIDSDHDQLVVTVDIDTVALRVPVPTDRAERLRGDINRALDSIDG